MEIRKIYGFTEETFSEGGKALAVPLRKATAVAVFKNPFAGRFVQELKPLTDASGALAVQLGNLAKTTSNVGKHLSALQLRISQQAER